MSVYLQHPIVVAALAGAIAAARVDFHAFKSWQSFDEAVTYSWKTAVFRWIQGAIVGAVMGAGLGL